MKNALVLVLASLALGGCALLSKGDVPVRRYYSPDLPSEPTARLQRPGSELRLGRVTAGAYIAERIMFRETAHEVGFYDDQVWTEKPEAYLRRGLTRVLFEEQGLRSVVRGVGPTLDVELITFEEVRSPVPLGRVKLAFSLSDERVVSLQQTLIAEVPVGPSTPQTHAAAVAHALGEALRDAINQLSGRVVTDLARAATVAPRSLATAP